jgi:hypothetical protein
MIHGTLKNERGIAAMFLVLLLSVLAALTMVFQISASSRGETRRHTSMIVQADGVARTGLDEALAWFRRQDMQPVRAQGTHYKDAEGVEKSFDYDDQAFMPGAAESLRPDIGLVQEYPLSSESGLWARFEVRRQTTNNKGTPAHDDPRAVHDITEKYFGALEAGRGLCWSVEALGVVFKPKGPITLGKAYNPANEEIIARSRAYTEIRRVGLTPPTSAALIVTDARLFSPDDTTDVGLEAGTDGVALAFYEPPEVGRDLSGFMGSVPEDKRFKDLGEGALSVQAVFGTSLSSLKGLADFYVRGTDLPKKVEAYPEYGLIFIDGDAVFDETHPFPKNGVVIVNGRMEKVRDVPAIFSGALYVTGDLVMQGPGGFSGVVMAENLADIRGDYGQMALWQDMRTVNFTVQRIGQYRQDRSVRFMLGAS